MRDVPHSLSKVPIMQLHDRSDFTVPWEGGMTGDGFIYESLSSVLAVWARNHKCNSTRKLWGINTPYDGANADMRCYEFSECQDGKVMQCMFDGHHGAWPKSTEKLTWWFFSQYLPADDVES